MTKPMQAPKPSQNSSFYNSGLLVNYLQGTFGAAGHATTAASALFFIDSDDIPFLNTNTRILRFIEFCGLALFSLIGLLNPRLLS
jgi:hypothetical protein